MKTLAKILLATGMAAALGAPAAAATQTANLGVSANIAGTCSIGVGSMAFGAYSGAALNGTATFTVNCTSGIGYAISANNGNNFSTTRRLTSGAGNFLSYSLYTEATRTTTWDTTAGHTVLGSGSGADQTITVYGTIPATQSANTGNFSDTVTMTITY